MSGYIPVDLQRRVRERFANCCAYCHTAEALTAMTFEFEHIVPRAAGGETTYENLCFACPFCNRHKSNHQNAIDPVTHETVPLFHPHQQIWAEHFAWQEKGVELIGLTPVGRTTIAALQMNRPQLVRTRRLWIKLGEHPPKID